MKRSLTMRLMLLFSLLLAALIRGDYDPEIVLETVRRTLY